MDHASGEVVEITAASVRRGDVIMIGNQPFKITDFILLGGHAKRVRFDSGETFTMHSQTRLSAIRPAKPVSPCWNE